MSSPSPALTPRRALPVRVDARRNRERILDAAALVFRDDPGAGMPDLAAAAKVSRATLYRHFAGRDDVINALRAEVVDEVTQTLRSQLGPIARGEDGAPSVTSVLDELVGNCLNPDARYRDVMAGHPARAEELVLQFRTVIQALVRRGQTRGEFSRSVPGDVLAQGLEGVIAAALHSVAAGTASLDEGTRMYRLFLGAMNGSAGRGR